MKSFTTRYDSIIGLPANRVLGRTTTGVGKAEILDDAALQNLVDVYTKAQVDALIAGVTGFQPLDSDLTAIAALSTTAYGRSLLALADEAAGRSALGLAGLSTDANGVASLNGSAAAYRAYGPTGVPYVSLLHDGTNGSLATSSGDVALAPASGVVSIPSGSHMIKWGSAGTGLCLRMTAGSNPQLDVRDHTNSIYGRVRADTYFFNGGQSLYDNGTNFGFFHSNGAYRPVYTGNQRIYDTAGNTAYLALSHDGTLGNINNPTGDVVLSASNTPIARVRSETATGITLPSHAFLAFSSTTSPNGSFDTVIGRYGAGIALAGTALGSLRFGFNGTNAIVATSSNDLQLRASGAGTNRIAFCDPNGNVRWYFNNTTGAIETPLQYAIKWTGQSVGLYPNSAGVLEINNGTAGTLRDVKARTFYGIAQASTDVAVCAQAHASQGSTSPVLKVINSAGSQLVGVLPDALQLGPAVTMKLSFDGPTNVSGANYIMSSYDTFRFATYGGTTMLGGGTLSLAGNGGDAIITNGDRGAGLKLVAIDGYGDANTAGTHITYCAGRPTGNAAGGSHKFQVAPSVGVSGTTFGTLIDALTLNSNCVLFIANSPSVPAIDPVGGGNLYVESGALKYRGSSGTVTIIAAA